MKQDFFTKAFNDPNVEHIPFNDKWINNSSLENACYQRVDSGVIQKSYDLRNQVRVLLLGTRLGTLVFYDAPEMRHLKRYHRLCIPILFTNSLRAALGLVQYPAQNSICTILGLGKGVRKHNLGQMIEVMFDNLENSPASAVFKKNQDYLFGKI